MKCIHCNADSKYKERSDRRCSKCKHVFAFEPKDGDIVTDMLFNNAIRSVSGEGKLRWGVEHLYYEINRRKRVRRVPWFVIALLLLTLLVTAALLLMKVANCFMFVLGGALLLATLASLATRLHGPLVRISQSDFNALWSRWKDVHSKPTSVIERAPEQALPKDLEADIGDYSFDRAVICDRARTVDLLVANNFHFENNCAVLSVDGYPRGPFKTIKAMLKRNPRLQVFVLHDSTPAGCRLAQKLATDPDWFGGCGLRIIDLGLRPNHAGPFRGLLLHSEGVELPADGLRPGEAEWLSKYRLELAAVRPEQVLKRLFRGVTTHAKDDPRTGDSSGSSSVGYCDSFESGGATDGTTDSGDDAFG